MPVNLSKGGNVSLTREAPGLEHLLIGMGWDSRITSGESFDLDASAFLLGANGRVRTDDDFIFYNNGRSRDGGVVYGGDNLTGAGDGDDETITVNLKVLSPGVQKIVIGASINDAELRRQNFGMVVNSYIRIVDQSAGIELVRFDLGEDYGTETALLFGEVYRHNGEWKFRATGQGFTGGLVAMAKAHGVNV